MDWMAELRRGGFKATPQRALVLRVLEEEGVGHLTAEEIGRAVEARAVALNRSTVYRTLETLVQLGLVRATRIGRSTNYELAPEGHEHHHIACSVCKATVPLPMGRAADILRREAEHAGYSVEDIDVLVTGICSACRAAAAAG